MKMLVLIGALSCLTLTACGNSGAQDKGTQEAEEMPVADISAGEEPAGGQTKEDSEEPADGQASETGSKADGGSADAGKKTGASVKLSGEVIKVEDGSITVKRITSEKGGATTAEDNLKIPDKVVVSFSDGTVFTVLALQQVEGTDFGVVQDEKAGTAADLKVGGTVCVTGSLQSDVLEADSISITQH